MLLERIKTLALSAVLAAHNAVMFCAMNVVMWRNNLWRRKRWTAKTAPRKSEILNSKPETNSKSQTPIPQTTAFEI